MITVKNLTKTYETYNRGSGFIETVKSLFHREKTQVEAVKDVSFEIEKGCICGLLGPNGAGKSTIIKMLCGTLFPTSGEIRAMGFSPYADRKRYVQKIGAVFGQRSQLVWDIPPCDSFNMNRAIYGISHSEYTSWLDELSHLFELEEIIRKPTRVLSLGERMKCEFVMAMLHKPKIVFLDEPTIGLDVIAKQTIRDFVQKMNRMGTTFILTTHDLDDVKQLANRVIIINHGDKVFDDTLQQLQSNLGDKKIVELRLADRLDGKLDNTPDDILNQLGKGVKLIAQKSPVEWGLEVDMTKITIGDFIGLLSQKVAFMDISVKELPMESIIAEIFLREEGI